MISENTYIGIIGTLAELGFEEEFYMNVSVEQAIEIRAFVIKKRNAENADATEEFVMDATLAAVKTIFGKEPKEAGKSSPVRIEE